MRTLTLMFKPPVRCTRPRGRGRGCVQPGGSVRDAEVLVAVEQAGAAMLITGTRHFRH